MGAPPPTRRSQAFSSPHCLQGSTPAASPPPGPATACFTPKWAPPATAAGLLFIAVILPLLPLLLLLLLLDNLSTIQRTDDAAVFP